MRDLIDERNERERISKSIIKYWNVNYIPKQPEVEEPVDEESEQAAVSLEEENTEGLYNETTGSYSGTYGKQDVEDEVTKGQIEKILHEKTENLRHLIDENKC